MQQELFRKLSLFPDLELVLKGKSASQYFEHIREKVTYYDRAISDCIHAREFKKLSFAQITKLHKLEKELVTERRKYKRIFGYIQNNKVKIAAMLDGLKFIYSTMKDNNMWKPKTDALKEIIKEEK
jgi:hypothetical protein